MFSPTEFSVFKKEMFVCVCTCCLDSWQRDLPRMDVLIFKFFEGKMKQREFLLQCFVLQENVREYIKTTFYLLLCTT